MTHSDPEHKAIAELAYRLWIDRGSPVGNPEEDWYRAEEELGGTHRRRVRTAFASSAMDE